MQRTSVKTFCTRLLARLSLALVLGGLVAPAASADGVSQSDRWIDLMVIQWSATCADAGGQAQISFDFNIDGSVGWALVTCYGQTGSWGPNWSCLAKDTGDWACYPFFTRPPETITHSVTAQDGTVVEAADTGSESTPTPIVIDRATGGPDAPERPTATPETVPTDQNDERTP